MGSFGLQFSDDFSRHKPTPAFEEELKKSSDSFFQKSLAYCSYYIMFFVAYCVVTPEKMELATNAVTRFLA